MGIGPELRQTNKHKQATHTHTHYPIVFANNNFNHHTTTTQSVTTASICFAIRNENPLSQAQTNQLPPHPPFHPLSTSQNRIETQTDIRPFTDVEIRSLDYASATTLIRWFPYWPHICPSSNQPTTSFPAFGSLYFPHLWLYFGFQTNTHAAHGIHGLDSQNTSLSVCRGWIRRGWGSKYTQWPLCLDLVSLPLLLLLLRFRPPDNFYIWMCVCMHSHCVSHIGAIGSAKSVFNKSASSRDEMILVVHGGWLVCRMGSLVVGRTLKFVFAYESHFSERRVVGECQIITISMYLLQGKICNNLQLL